MRFPIPFGYECKVVTSGGNEVVRRYRETVEIDVPEFEPGALPAVLSWRGHHQGGVARVDALYHDGGLYEVVTFRRYAGEGGWENVPVRLEDALSAVSDAMAKKPFEHGVLHARDVFVSDEVRKVFSEDAPYPHKGPPKPATVVRDRFGNDGRERALERVRDRGEGFVSVGGVLHRRVPEPVLVAAPEGLGLQSEPESGKGLRVFRLDDVELALERARIIAKDRKAEVRRPDFQLHRPDLLGREVEGAALHGAARGLLGIAHRGLATASLATMEAYCDLKEALTPYAATYAERREPDPAELVRLGRILVDRVRVDFPEHQVVAEEAAHGFDRAEARLVPADVAGPAPR